MCKALIIDDEDAICRLIIYALSRHGIDADIATSGSEGLEKFNRENFDVVVTDMLLPDVDGNAIARHIRGTAGAKTPIIGITGTSWLMDRSRFDAVFEKPFPIHLLVETIKRVAGAPPETAAAGA